MFSFYECQASRQYELPWIFSYLKLYQSIRPRMDQGQMALRGSERVSILTGFAREARVNTVQGHRLCMESLAGTITWIVFNYHTHPPLLLAVCSLFDSFFQSFSPLSFSAVIRPNDLIENQEPHPHSHYCNTQLIPS